MMLARMAAIAGFLAVAGPAAAAGYVPPPLTPFDVQLQGRPAATPGTAFLELDAFGTSAGTVAALRARGLRLACYVSVGTAETYRPDYDRLKPLAGNRLASFPDERWLDVRAVGRLTPIMAARFRMCRDKGFESVGFDNVTGYLPESRSGFPLTKAHELRYLRRLAAEVHAQGLSIGINDSPPVITELADTLDWVLNESCLRFGECAALRPFIDRGKAVFVIEYVSDPARRRDFCEQARTHGIGLIFKRPALRQELARCP